MLITTLERFEGKEVRFLGLVRGNSIVRTSLGGIRNPTVAYAERMEETRELAIKKMIERAKELGANAIIGVRFSTLPLLSELVETLVYGTAAKIEE